MRSQSNSLSQWLLSYQHGPEAFFFSLRSLTKACHLQHASYMTHSNIKSQDGPLTSQSTGVPNDLTFHIKSTQNCVQRRPPAPRVACDPHMSAGCPPVSVALTLCPTLGLDADGTCSLSTPSGRFSSCFKGILYII